MMIVQMKRELVAKGLIATYGILEWLFLKIARKDWPNLECRASHHTFKTQSRTHFFRMPVLVLPRLLVALLAAGVLTAFPAGAGAWFVGVAPILLPVVP
jgi:hypothetical protein